MLVLGFSKSFFFKIGKFPHGNTTLNTCRRIFSKRENFVTYGNTALDTSDPHMVEKRNADYCNNRRDMADYRIEVDSHHIAGVDGDTYSIIPPRIYRPDKYTKTDERLIPSSRRGDIKVS